MSKFIVGDRVKYINQATKNKRLLGKLGVVKDIFDYIGEVVVVVEFDNPDRFPYCCLEDSLELVKVAPPNRIKKFLFVEDGSVDVDALEEALEDGCPDIHVVVYRQGSTPPKLVDIYEVEDGQRNS